MAIAEDLGTGINNVFTFLKPYAGTVPEFNEEQLFKVIVPLKNELNGENEPLNEPLSARQKRIIQIIKANSKITIIEIAKLCNAGRETIKRDLEYLQNINLLKRTGSKKTGHWKIL